MTTKGLLITNMVSGDTDDKRALDYIHGDNDDRALDYQYGDNEDKRALDYTHGDNNDKRVLDYTHGDKDDKNNNLKCWTSGSINWCESVIVSGCKLQSRKRKHFCKITPNCKSLGFSAAESVTSAKVQSDK